MHKIRCYTLFDCTATGITGRNRHRAFPVTTALGTVITQADQLALAMHQQRNWDTFLQVISLRTQPDILLLPVVIEDLAAGIVGLGRSAKQVWMFEFNTDRQDVFLKGTDPLGYLLDDAHGVPMLRNLTEFTESLEDYVVCQGSRPNTVFVEI